MKTQTWALRATMRSFTVLIGIWTTLCAACATTQPQSRPSKLREDPIQKVAATDLYQQGVALYQQGDLIRAEQYFSASMTHGYPARAVLPALLKTCLAGSRIRAAAHYAAQHLEKSPEDWGLRYVLASLHMSLGNHDSARRELLRVTQAWPRFSSAHYLLAVLYRDDLLDVKAARSAFGQYLRLDPHGEHAAEAREFLRQKEPAFTGAKVASKE
jgi:tetratricopeptide (TPR) repeat protein